MKKKIVVFGFGYEGVVIYKDMMLDSNYELLGFVDNAKYKQGNIAFGYPIRSMEEFVRINTAKDISVIVASKEWLAICKQVDEEGINIEYVYFQGKKFPYEPMTFHQLDLSKEITLYAGNISDDIHMKEKDLYGLALNYCDRKHIHHDITHPYPLPDNSIYSYQAEDVLEHIEIDKIVPILDEIYRILKPNSLLRICLPDYNTPMLRFSSMCDQSGKILYDPCGGGKYGADGLSKGSHMWFPTYENVKEILSNTAFSIIQFLCYRNSNGDLVRKGIDYSKGYIRRVTDTIADDDIYSIVVDCYK